MTLTELELKLARLALDRAAQVGEIEQSAIRLFHSWRARGIKAEDFLSARYKAPDYGLCQMPFGKHKGLMFREIPPSYLRWLVRELKKSPHQKFPFLRIEIETFLAQ